MIDKTYQPSEVEGRIYRTWEQAGAFRAGRPERARADVYSIVIPPPNVTGSLHMGHALNNTLQDILCRFERMRGKDVLWQPGTDHAGIATQMVVERQLMELQQPGRREMGREAFLKRVWEWKAESGGTIVNQLKRLGASCDWSRERFTMGKGGEPNDQMVRAVMKAFVDLFNDGLIYKDKRLVNWDPKLLTAISDLEVVQVETKGSMWHFRYPLADDPSKYICIATTRPETMLGDGAVAVHPDDERYKHLVGKLVRLPLAERLIPVIADEYPDPEKGSGAVKITAAHDFNDFEVWYRHRDKDYFKKQLNGGLINLFTPEAKMNENCPPTVSWTGPLRSTQAHRCRSGSARPGRQDRKDFARRAAWRPLERGGRALFDRPMVCERERTCETGDRRGARGQDRIRPEELGGHLLQLDGKHPAMVHLATIVVGPPDSGLVRTGRKAFRCAD